MYMVFGIHLFYNNKMLYQVKQQPKPTNELKIIFPAMDVQVKKKNSSPNIIFIFIIFLLQFGQDHPQNASYDMNFSNLPGEHAPGHIL